MKLKEKCSFWKLLWHQKRLNYLELAIFLKLCKTIFEIRPSSHLFFRYVSSLLKHTCTMRRIAFYYQIYYYYILYYIILYYTYKIRKKREKPIISLNLNFHRLNRELWEEAIKSTKRSRMRNSKTKQSKRNNHSKFINQWTNESSNQWKIGDIEKQKEENRYWIRWK